MFNDVSDGVGYVRRRIPVMVRELSPQPKVVVGRGLIEGFYFFGRDFWKRPAQLPRFDQYYARSEAVVEPRDRSSLIRRPEVGFEKDFGSMRA